MRSVAPPRRLRRQLRRSLISAPFGDPVDRVSGKASNRISSVILFAAVAFAPLPFGSTAPVVIAAWCVLLGAGLMLASPRGLRPGQLIPIAVVAVVVFGSLIVLHEQLSSAPWFAVAPDPIWRETASLLNSPVAASLSIARNEPFTALGAPLAAILALTTSYIVCADRNHAHRLFTIVAWSGAGYALLGIVLFLIDPTMLLWREKSDYVSSLTGPFVNRNTAAVYFGSCAIVSLLLFLRDISSHRGDQGLRLEDLLSAFGRGRDRSWTAGISLFRLAVLLAALLMTNSRAGVVFSLLGLAAAFVLLQVRRLNRRQNAWILGVVAVGVVLALLQMLGGSVGARFDQSGLTDVARMDAYRSTFRMIADHPWLGTGLGTFVWSFPPYRADGAIWGTWNRAHNTLLEIASDMGLLFALLVVAAWILIIGLLINGIRVRRRDLFMPIAALCVASVSVAHSLIDFSLQISGYAIVACALIGAGMAQSFSGRQRTEGLR
jgi:O-antigen ligase